MTSSSSAAHVMLLETVLYPIIMIQSAHPPPMQHISSFVPIIAQQLKGYIIVLITIRRGETKHH